MTRSLVSLLALACVFTVGCPGGTDGDTKPVDTFGDDTSIGGDEDDDGYKPSDGDCDDSNPDVNPGADEICDGKDNNCDGQIDENGETEYYADADGDGFGDPNVSVMACEPDTGYVSNSDDCDDAETTVYPGADEQCDGLDNDCDELIDEDLTSVYYHDADGDGYGDESWTVDACADPGDGWVSSGGDCNDSEPFAWTGATEICDGIDNNCDGTIDEGLGSTWYPDADSDGYGDDSAVLFSCSDPGAGYIGSGGDCNDAEPLAWTGASEYCDDVDNDCNGLVDDSALDASAQVADDDGDGFGSPTAVTYACAPIVTNTWDCDDGNAYDPQVVDDSASSGTANGSITNPWTTIQEGIDGASMCVVVFAGSYTENINFNGKDVDVFSTDGSASTIIDGAGAGSVVTFENGETLGASLRGFSIENGGGTLESTVTTTTDGSGTISTTTYNRYYGGGIIVDNAAPTLDDLYVAANVLPAYSYTVVSSVADTYVYSYGGGLFANNSSGMVVNDVVFAENYADEGGGVFAGDAASFEMTATRIVLNEASNGAGLVVSGGTVDLTNAILAGNVASGDGGGAWIDGGSSIWWNVGAVGNTGTNGAGVAVTDSGFFYLYNSAITNSNTGAGVFGTASETFAAEYSDVYGNAGGEFSGVTDPTGSTGNIAADPAYTSWTDNGTDDDNLTPASGSPLIDAGNPSAAYNDVDGTTNDIGAYGGPGGGW